MFGDGRLSVIVAVVVLAGCACARPNVESIEDNSITSNVSGATQPQPQESTPTPTPTLTPTATPEPVPVNERFPHAVLFGGTCGGSIISPNWVITAGHCSIFTSGRYVLAGTNNSDDGSGTYVNVKRLVIHPRFSVGPYWVDADDFNIQQVGARYDYMLAELNEPLPLDGKKMAAIKLDDQPSVPVGLEVGYAGYGAENHGETMRSQMHAMDLMIMPDNTCEKMEQYDKLDMLCTQGRPPKLDSACNGDSGSGLVGGGRLLGVASWVENDAHECRKGALVVFSRLSLVRDWIRTVTGV